jgi:hypothetical protein
MAPGVEAPSARCKLAQRFSAGKHPMENRSAVSTVFYVIAAKACRPYGTQVFLAG